MVSQILSFCSSSSDGPPTLLKGQGPMLCPLPASLTSSPAILLQSQAHRSLQHPHTSSEFTLAIPPSLEFFSQISRELALIIWSLLECHLLGEAFPITLFQLAILAPFSLFYPILFLSMALTCHTMYITHYNSSFMRARILFVH